MYRKISIINIIASAFLFSASANAPQLNLFSRASLQSTVSQALGGAGAAMPVGGMQGLINPALTATCKSDGSIAAGYGRDRIFDKTALPIGIVLTDNNGAMGLYYRFLDGNKGRVNDAAINFSGTVFQQAAAQGQGSVDFGMNIRYEHSVWPYIYENDDSDAAKMRSNNLLVDIGFYQPRIMENLDFALVIRNFTGYSWNRIEGADKTKGQIRGRHRTVVVGCVYNLALGDALRFSLPADIEMNNLFEKSLPNKYVLRTGLEGRISSYTVRFGYTNAPEDPMELITDFNHKNLFFGGVGVFVNPLQLDFFTGKKEWGVTATWFY